MGRRSVPRDTQTSRALLLGRLAATVVFVACGMSGPVRNQIVLWRQRGRITRLCGIGRAQGIRLGWMDDGGYPWENGVPQSRGLALILRPAALRQFSRRVDTSVALEVSTYLPLHSILVSSAIESYMEGL